MGFFQLWHCTIGWTWLSASFGGGISFFLSWLARLVGLPNARVAAGGVPGERTTEESYATSSWNQPPVKFEAERRFRGWCIGSEEGVFWLWQVCLDTSVYSGLFFGPNFPRLWHTFRPVRWQFRVVCCLWGRLKLLACWHRPVTWYGPIKWNPMVLDRMNEAAIRPDHFSR